MPKMASVRPKHILQGEQEQLQLPLCTLNYIEVDFITDILQEIEKRDTHQVVIKLAALETIRTLYPEQDWLHICMGGSGTDRNGNAGVGIHCKLFSLYLLLGQHATHFGGEREAMNTALRQLVSRIGSFKKAVIFNDSSAAVLSVAKFDVL
jgi:hypothetical protein